MENQEAEMDKVYKTKTHRMHYAWIICFTCMFMLFCNMGMSNTSFPAHLPMMREQTGISNTQCSTILMARNLTSLFCMMFVDRYLKKMNVKRGMLVASVIVIAAFIMYAFSKSFVMYLICAMISGVGYAYGGLIPASTLIYRWFEKNRRFAIGLCSAGTGVSSIILPPLVAALSSALSLRLTFLIEAGLIAVSAVVGFILLSDSPEERGLTALTDDSIDTAEKALKRADKDAPKSAILLVCGAAFLLAFAIYGSYPFLELHLVTEGYPVPRAALYLTIFGVTLTIGKMIYGWAADRFGALIITMICYMLSIVGIFSACIADSPIGRVILIGTIALWGFGNAISTVMQPTMAGELATDESFTRVAKNIQVSYTLGSVVIGPIPGMIADFTGSYTLSFAMLGCVIAASMILVAIGLRIRAMQTRRAAAASI